MDDVVDRLAVVYGVAERGGLGNFEDWFGNDLAISYTLRHI